jgi:hypothetical protein
MKKDKLITWSKSSHKSFEQSLGTYILSQIFQYFVDT